MLYLKLGWIILAKKPSQNENEIENKNKKRTGKIQFKDTVKLIIFR